MTRAHTQIPVVCWPTFLKYKILLRKETKMAGIFLRQLHFAFNSVSYVDLTLSGG